MAAGLFKRQDRIDSHGSNAIVKSHQHDELKVRILLVSVDKSVDNISGVRQRAEVANFLRAIEGERGTDHGWRGRNSRSSRRRRSSNIDGWRDHAPVCG